MPLLGLPSNYEEYREEKEPKKELVYKPPFGLTPFEDHRRVILFDNCPNWKCPKCGLTYHGRVKICRIIYTRNQGPPPCNEPRPESWKPYPIERSFNAT